jgi:hypothetical protein
MSKIPIYALVIAATIRLLAAAESTGGSGTIISQARRQSHKSQYRSAERRSIMHMSTELRLDIASSDQANRYL